MEKNSEFDEPTGCWRPVLSKITAERLRPAGRTLHAARS